MRTTLDLPDALFRDLKIYAAEHHLSLKAVTTEVIAKGLVALRQSPPLPRVATNWQPPSSAACGWRGLSADQLKEALWADSAPQLTSSQDDPQP
jgi:hypothetical protein